MTPSEKERCLKADRKWGISIKAMYRDSINTERDAGRFVGDLRSVVVITIRDPQKRGVLYDRCMAQLDTHNFVHDNKPGAS